MTREIFQQFSTHIARIDLSEEICFKEIQEELTEVIQDTQFNYKSEWGKTHKLSDVDFGNKLFERLTVLPVVIKSELTGFLLQISNSLGISMEDKDLDKRIKIESSWITQFDNNDFAHSHNHLDSHFSGVYYYQYPDNNDTGNFVIETPLLCHYCMPFYKNVSVTSVNNIKTGTLLFFPSYLRHGVRRYEGENPRISVSFNAKFIE